METIIGLLFLLLPVIFKLIGKRLEKSGNLDQAKKMREIYEAFGGDTEERQEEILPVEKESRLNSPTSRWRSSLCR